MTLNSNWRWSQRAVLLEVSSGSHVQGRGIPHLAKNERDMGHPSFVVRPSKSDRRKSFSAHVRLGERGAPVPYLERNHRPVPTSGVPNFPALTSGVLIVPEFERAHR